jgi:hypothetical protein
MYSHIHPVSTNILLYTSQKCSTTPAFLICLTYHLNSCFVHKTGQKYTRRVKCSNAGLTYWNICAVDSVTNTALWSMLYWIAYLYLFIRWSCIIPTQRGSCGRFIGTIHLFEILCESVRRNKLLPLIRQNTAHMCGQMHNRASTQQKAYSKPEFLF